MEIYKPSVDTTDITPDIEGIGSEYTLTPDIEEIGSECPLTPDEKIKSDRLLTPANVMTASRLLFASIATLKLLKGEQGATPYVIEMGLADMDGQVARFFDKYFPKLRIGTTKIGETGDYVIDSASLLIVSGASIISSNIDNIGKIAVTTILAQEGIKVIWGMKSAYNYSNIVKSKRNSNEKLRLPVIDKGKKATLLKFASLVCAVATNDTDNPALEKALGILSLGLAGVGIYHGEQARQEYDRQYKELLALLESDKA
jgi:hypothetical protein